MKNPRSILITGASSGIGAALALEYAAPGVFLALSGRDKARLDRTSETCRGKGAEVVAATVDVADMAAMRRWIEGIEAERPLDLVIANAGISGGKGGLTGDRLDEGKSRDIFAVNLAGVLNTVFPIIPAMRKRGRGQIAIMGSLAGFRGLPSAPAYSASKVAVKAWGEALRGVLAADGVFVSVVCPGFVESRITADNPFAMPLLMTAAKAARIIRKGLAKKRIVIAFPWIFAAVMWSLNLLPPCWVNRLLSRVAKKH